MEPARVLVVDDEADLASAMTERLALRGFGATAATGGEEALRRIRESPFDVAILDVKMPGIDGLHLMRRMKEALPRLQVILFSGQGSVSDREQGLQEGAFEYLLKPFEIDDLVDLVRKAAGS